MTQRDLARRALERIEFQNFTAFRRAELECVSGVNVFVGANSTGKTHAMKAAYVGLQYLGHFVDQPGALIRLLGEVFLPSGFDPGRLVNRRGSNQTTSFKIGGGQANAKFEGTQSSQWRIYIDDKKHRSRRRPVNRPVLYLPSRELFSMYEGFIAAYEHREVSFDKTYFDACVALSASPLKGEGLARAKELGKPLFETIGGAPVLEGTEFYLRRGKDMFEAHLVAEGHRKLAALYQLLLNGSLGPETIFFWDEPETNLNPVLIRLVADFLVSLAAAGTQIFVATHDYLLAHRLSLFSEYGGVKGVPIRFHAFSLDKKGDAQVTSGATLSDLPPNPIVEEFARHYEFERRLFQSEKPEAELGRS